MEIKEIQNIEDVLKTLKAKKKELGLTYDQISNLTELNVSTIKRTFSKETKPQMETVIKIAAALNVTIQIKH